MTTVFGDFGGDPGPEVETIFTQITDTAKLVEPGLRTYPLLKIAVDAPAIVCRLSDINYREVFESGDAGYVFDVIMLSSKVVEVTALRRAYGWANPRSALKQALNTIPGLTIAQATDFGDYQVGDILSGATLWGFTWRAVYDG